MRTLGGWAVSLLIALNASAGIIYSNYGPGFSYDTHTAWTADYPGVGYNPAMPFTPIATAMLNAIYVNIGNDLATSSLDVTLRSDSSGAPGAVIELFNVTSVPDALNGVAFPPLVLTSSLHPILNVGQQYWLAAAAHDPGGGFAWWFNSSGDVGQVFLAHNGTPGFVVNTRGVFELTSVPESSSLLLAASGLMALVWRNRQTAGM